MRRASPARPRPDRTPRAGSGSLTLALLLTCLGLLWALYRSEFGAGPAVTPQVTRATASLLQAAARRGGEEHGPVLVSYSYFEKDAVQRANLAFFVEAGMGQAAGFEPPAATDFVVVVSGEACSPCATLLPQLRNVDLGSAPGELAWAKAAPRLALLQRTRNEGMDFAAHNTTLEWVRRQGTARKYRFYIFLNSSVRGPFYPSYMPPGWQWTRAFTDRLEGRVKLVASSLVCLPEVDAGGPGPKAESWAYALDAEGLEAAVAATVFERRTCKLCPDGIVVKGEYGLTQSIMDAGYNIATLLSKYARGTDWRDPATWHCNDNVHPSRHGTYDHITMHPFETVFIKASWHVGEPFLSHYTQWWRAHGRGEAGTAGALDLGLYTYAISPEAQEPHDVAECYTVRT